ncbi:acetyl-CoA carboxylase carboxyltransferase subunit alpha [Clostridium fallax]|uniref:acetyl-CoA carboxylase carboxyltransferase subunit alpha n=1 Tax=Clostridium fallax TaxID=1533 RepID=UPI000D90E0E8|nr:acetyl-CoA carboxylase carboxyltransferase subunit alpha [Clostridium fallax]SQB07674.1 acetyl-CoA carboxylase carboxyltransferase subunit alpha [Clostridium fallax]
MNNKLSPWERLTLARMAKRPTSLEYINEIFDDFIELHGDRGVKDDGAIVGGLGYLEDIPVTIIGIQRGRNIEENIKRNFGSPNPEGYRKALRLMKQGEKFNRPIICFIDTKGAFFGVEAEERGQGEAIARNLLEMAGIKTPIISIIIGEGGSGGALGLAVGDKVWMLENSVYSILSPEGFASILWKDSTRTHEAAEVMKITSYDLLNLNIIEKIIEEPSGGAQNDIKSVAESIKNSLKDELENLLTLDKEELIKARYERFRKF